MKREDFLKMKNGLYFKSVRYFVKFKDDEKIDDVEIYPYAGEDTRLIYISKDDENTPIALKYQYEKDDISAIVDVKTTFFLQREFICGFGTNDKIMGSCYTKKIDYIYKIYFYKKANSVTMDKVVKKLSINDYKKFYRDTNYELKDYSKGDMLI